MSNNWTATITIILISIFSAIAQLTPEQAIAEMGRGINLGNTLEPPTEGSWNNGPARESFFDAYVDAGFSNIRIPVRWDQHTSNSTPFVVNSNWMDRVEEVVDWGLSRGFYVTLNGHHEDWLKNNYALPNIRARYDAIWTQVAERFKDKSEKLLFEIINEPKGMTVAEVDDLNNRILGIMRETNPTRIVIYGGNMYANSEQLFDAEILDDEYIIGYYHAYDPWQFSGEGQGTWGSPGDYQLLNNKYQEVANWSADNEIPIHHSEFGAIHECDYNSRMRIYAHNVERCIVHNFAFSVWDDGGMFGILNRSNNTWPEVKDILVHYYPDSPNEILSTASQDTDTGNPIINVNWNNRTNSTNSIILERANNTANNFEQIAELAYDATSYSDSTVELGKTYTYRMYTTRDDGTLLHGYPTRIKVDGTVDQAPFTGTATEIPGILEAEEYDVGGEGVSYEDADPNNIPNAFRMDEGVDIGAYGDGFVLEYTEDGEWLEYTVNVTESGSYHITADVASEVGGGDFSLFFFKNFTTVNFDTPNTGSWTNYEEITALNTVNLEEGEQVIRLAINNNNSFNLDKLNFQLATNTSDVNLENIVTVGPNPTKGNLSIEVTDFEKNNINRVTIFDVDGESIDSFDISKKILNIDMSEYSNGLYILNFSGNNISYSQSVIKH